MKDVKIKGSYKTARKIGDEIFIVSQKYGHSFFGGDSTSTESFLPHYRYDIYGDDGITVSESKDWAPVCKCDEVGAVSGDGGDDGDGPSNMCLYFTDKCDFDGGVLSNLSDNWQGVSPVKLMPQFDGKTPI